MQIEERSLFQSFLHSLAKVSIVIAIIIAILFGIFQLTRVFFPGNDTFLNELLPGRRVHNKPLLNQKTLNDSQVREYLAQIDDLENQFDKLIAITSPKQEDIDKLNEALEIIDNISMKLPQSDRVDFKYKQERIMVKLHDCKALPLSHQYLSQMNLAEASFAKKDLSKAKSYAIEALNIQEDINNQYRKSQYYSMQNIIDTKAFIDTIEATPYINKIAQLEKISSQNIADSSWVEAKANLNELIRQVEALKNRFRSTIGTSFKYDSILEKAKIELDSLNSSKLFEEVEDLITQGKSFEEQSQIQKAAINYEIAAKKLEEINRFFPQSKFSSTSKVKDLIERKQNILSLQDSKEINKLEKELNEALISKNNEIAISNSVDLIGKIDRFTRKYPNSGLVSADLLIKARYIFFMRQDIDFIQSSISSMMHSVPDMENVEMSKTEISQALYQKIMQQNPSAKIGKLLPVESVSYNDAILFCKRLSYLSGKEITLPSIEIYKKALGNLKYANMNDISWNLVNANGSSQNIGSSKSNNIGYFDLLGNVWEWVLAVDGSESSLRFGGSFMDSADFLLSLPSTRLLKNEKNRITGFRIVSIDSNKESK